MKKNYDLELATFIEKQNISSVREVKWDIAFITNKLYQEVENIELNSYEEVNAFAKALKLRENCYGISDYFNIHAEEDLSRFKSECTDSVLCEGKAYLTQLKDYCRHLEKSDKDETWSDKVALAMCLAIRDGSWFSKVCKNKIRRNITSKMSITSLSQSDLSQYYSDFVLDNVQKKLWGSFHSDFVGGVNSYLRTHGSAYKTVNYAYKNASYDNEGDLGLQYEIDSLATTPTELGGGDIKVELIEKLEKRLKSILTDEEYAILYYNSNYTRFEFEKDGISYSKTRAYGSDYKNVADYVNSQCGFKGTEKELSPERLTMCLHAIKKRINTAFKYDANSKILKGFSKERQSTLNWENAKKREAKRHRVQENCNLIYEAEYNKFFGHKDFNEERCALAFEMKNDINSLDDDVYFKIAKLSKHDCENKSAEFLDGLQGKGYKAKSKEYELCL